MKRRGIALAIVAILAILVLTTIRESSIPAVHIPDINNHHASSSPTTSLQTSKVAAIMETRASHNLIPLILHFSSVLGPTWPIKIFTTAAVVTNLSISAPFKRHLDDKSFEIVYLPEGQKFNTHKSVSTFFTSAWFWEQLAPADHVLMFQADSMLCSNSPRKVDDFLQWDFVGAPVDSGRGLGNGYNGGLSIRNVTMVLDIVKSSDWEADRASGKYKGIANVDYEDQYFYAKMKERNATLPSPEEAVKFSVETMWGDQPLGYHQPNVWQPTRMDEIMDWCPEYRMCTKDTYKTH
jgi:hypothetical protein